MQLKKKETLTKFVGVRIDAHLLLKLKEISRKEGINDLSEVFRQACQRLVKEYFSEKN